MKQKQIITAQDNIIKDKCAEVAKHNLQNNESQLKIKELDHSISKHKREADDAAAKVWLCWVLQPGESGVCFWALEQF